MQMPVVSECSFASADGVRLYGRLHRALAPRAALVVVEGYGEHCARYDTFAAAAASAGLTTLAFDLRGHGRSDGRRAFIRRVSEYEADIDAAIATASGPP